jgi:type I restriction enzyme S subunit
MKLGEICETSAGGTPLKSEKAYYAGGDIPWLLSGEVNSKNITLSKNFISRKGLDNSSAKVFPPNTVLVAMYGATAGQVGILRFHAATNQAVCGILPNDRVIPEYLYYLLLSKKSTLVAQAVGNAQPNISQQKIRNTEIELPPLIEQKRIVAMLDEAFEDIDKARELTEQNLKNARELYDSYLDQMLSPKASGWKRYTLGDLCVFENGDRGKNYPSRSNFVSEGIAFINAGHIDNGQLKLDEMNYITEANFNRLGRGKVRKGDILFCLRGSLGKFAVIENEMRGAIASSLVILRPNSLLKGNLLLHYLRSKNCSDMIRKYAGGAAQPNLGAKDLSKFEICIPEQTEQEAVSKKLDKLLSHIDSLEEVYREKCRSISILKNSILQQAFKFS